MIMNMNEKRGRAAIIAAVAVLMLATVCFVGMGSEDVYATEDGPTYTDSGATATVTDVADFNTALDNSAVTKIILGADITTDVTISEGKTITLDLNGFTLTNSSTHTVTVNNGAKITFIDSSAEKDGTVDNVTHGKAALAIVYGGEAVIDGGNFTRSAEAGTSSNSWYVIRNEGTLTINGGTVTSKVTATSEVNSSSIVNGWTESDKKGVSDLNAHEDGQFAVMTITGGTITGGGYVKNDFFGKMTITGGNISGANAAVYSQSELTISGGNFTVETENKSAIYLDEAEGQTATTRITAGTFTVNSPDTNERGAIYIIGNGNDVNINLSTIAAPIVVTENAVINGTITLGTGSASGTISLNNVTAGAGVKISLGSIAIEGAFTTDETGNITITGQAKLTGNVTLTEGTKLTIAEGATLNIPTGMTLDATGATISNSGTISTVDDNSITMTETSTYMSSPTASIVKVVGDETQDVTSAVIANAGNIQSTATDSDTALGLENYLENNLTISGQAFLSKNLTIREGVTLTIASTGSLSLNGHSLILEGNLVILNGGSITAVPGDDEEQGIFLTRTGSIDNAGVIGKGANDVTVYAATTGAANETAVGDVSLQNVTGISFGLNRVVDNGNITYTLTFNGNAVRNGTGNYLVTSNGAIVNGDLNIGSNVIFTAGVDGSVNTTVSKNSTVTVNGTIGGTIELLNGATIVLSGTTANDGVTVTAYTGEYESRLGISSLSKQTTVEVIEVTGITLTVASETYMKDIAGVNTSYTEQKLIMSGNAAKTSGADNPTVTVEGNLVYVEDQFGYSADSTNGIGFNVTNNGKMEVTGQVVISGATVEPTYLANVTGTYYSVQSTVSGVSVTTQYITGFDQAYSQIENAVGKNITVYGELELSSAYDIQAGQTLTIGAGATIKIASGGDIEVFEQGVIVGTIDDVDGILTVYYGGVCSAPNKFDVRTTNTVGDVIYSGLAIALENANEGDTVNLVQNTTVEGSLNIPAGVTLDVNQGATLEVERNLTVEGTLLNHGTVTVDRNTVVSGTADTTEGTFTAPASGYTVTSTGTMKFAPGTVLTNSYNGTSYVDEDTNVVLSNFADAIAAATASDVNKSVTVYGKVNEMGGITVDGVDITIASGAEVTITTLTLDDCDLIINGKFTGSVSAATGDEGATVQSTLQLGAVESVTVSSSSQPNEANVNVWYLYIDSTDVDDNLRGTVSVNAGAVTQKGDIVVNNSSTQASVLTIASGAEYIVPEGTEITSAADKSLTVNGTITVNGTLNAVAGVLIAGTLDIADGGNVEVTSMNVTGTVNVVETETETGTLTISEGGMLVVGEKPTSLGAGGTITGTILFGNAASTIKAYAGADLSAMEFAETANIVSTEYQINGATYMTIYAPNGNSIAIKYMADQDKIQINGYVTPSTDGASDTKWYNDGTEVSSSYIGAYAVVTTEFEVATINGTISVGTGLTMYIDGLTISNWLDANNRYYLTVGTHIVSIAANAQYDASNATITFNGQTMANGSTITVDADADGFTLAASGAVPSTSSGGSSSITSGDDGMGLTDYLLIILVILIVVMAIMVAMRLMRS